MAGLPLPQLAKNNARMIARDAWLESGQDVDAAVWLAEDRMGRKVGQIYLRQARALAKELIRHWARQGRSEPESVFTAGEPGANEGAG